MNLLLAVSKDGFLCKGPDDDMKWTGPLDKFAFKLLTMSSDQPLLAGSTTYNMMPKLPGRSLYRLSQKGEGGLTLEEAHFYYPHAWVIGGPTVAEQALKKGLIDRVFLCSVDKALKGGVPVEGLLAHLHSKPKMVIRLGSYQVVIFDVGVNT
ncbi:dihydrofolate reductase [Pseudomonas phage ZQG1]|nr:dihydrofolate reductase [Pseudomonas phage ZQG1]